MGREIWLKDELLLLEKGVGRDAENRMIVSQTQDLPGDLIASCAEPRERLESWRQSHRSIYVCL